MIKKKLFASKNFLTNNNDNFAKGDKGADSGVDSNSVFFFLSRNPFLVIKIITNFAT